MKRALVILCALVSWSTAKAQAPVIIVADGPAPSVIVGAGWEAFPEIYYQGGDASQPKKRNGMLVLTDSALAFYECAKTACLPNGSKSMIRGDAWWTVPLKSMKEIRASNRASGSMSDSRLLLGLGGDRNDDMIGFVYETSSSAEAPIFKTRNAQAAAIEAKVKFRLKKLGVALP